MKPLLTTLDFGCPLHGNRCWQECIDTTYPRKIFSAYRCIEMNHLRKRMHPGIGATGTHHRNAGTDRNGHCLLQHALHGSQHRQSWRLLPLPAVEVGAVIGDDQSEARHAGRIGKTCRGILVIGISQALLFILLTIRDGMGALGKQVLDFVRAGSTVVLRRLPVYADPESLSPRRRASSHFPTESPEK
jgi:hypothetical protein